MLQKIAEMQYSVQGSTADDYAGLVFWRLVWRLAVGYNAKERVSDYASVAGYDWRDVVRKGYAL